MTWSMQGQALPEEDSVAPVTTPIILRGSFRSGSFGHLVRDNMQALVELPLLFRASPEDYTWVVWAKGERGAEPALPDVHLAAHYVPWISSHPPQHWQQVLAEREGAHPTDIAYARGQGPCRGEVH